MAIPTLQTERLVLRAPILDDYPAYAALMGSDRAVFMGGPFNERAAWGMFTSDLAMWQLYGHGALMIEVIETGDCAGQVGINHGPLFPEKELGWLLFDGFEGRGYATEAAEVLRDWAFEILRLETLVSYFDPGNFKSMAVSARLGGVRDQHAPVQDEGDVVFRYWRNNHSE